MTIRPALHLLLLPLAVVLSTLALPSVAGAQTAPADDVPTRGARPAPPTPPDAPPPARPLDAARAADDAPPPIPADAPPLPAGALPSGYLTPPRYKLRYEERRMTGLMAAGLGIFGGTYFLTAVFGGYVTEHGWFYLPVFGPVIYKSDDKSQEAALIFDTIVQAGGVAMAIAGALVKTKVAVREPITLLPITVPGGGAGLAAVGTW